MAGSWGWYAEKLAKVRKYDMADKSERDGRMVAADYESGRKAFPLAGCTTKAAAIKNQEYAATHKTVEQQFIEADMRRYGIEPTKKVVRNYGMPRFPVYYANGNRALFRSFDEAFEELTNNESAVKMWDCDSHEYLIK